MHMEWRADLVTLLGPILEQPALSSGTTALQARCMSDCHSPPATRVRLNFLSVREHLGPGADRPPELLKHACAEMGEDSKSISLSSNVLVYFPRPSPCDHAAASRTRRPSTDREEPIGHMLFAS
jgi:hypothetical protein